MSKLATYSGYRLVEQIIHAMPTSDGDGVKIARLAGFNRAAFSPFLMIDELKSDDTADYMGGFPPHPHRGIETLTYMLQGHFQHKDHMGDVGELRSGGAQWMAAGKGVIHSEMPIMQEGQLHGFQIWINQPARDKMNQAKYHDFQSEVITQVHQDHQGLLRVISGRLEVKQTPVFGPLQQTGVPATVADWRASAGDRIEIGLPVEHNVMIYVYQGQITVTGTQVQQGQLALLSAGEMVDINAEKESGAILFSGQPIDEPVVHYGPFVMNSMAEIEQAIDDYNSGQFETY
ncbi:pirin family protein [Vibrio panuliri]|uniref:Quercetin 2,3-dioxygenase n=1 Tax=Vibrio panuliri TaxID=1381081 RepID=A0ABX3FQ89_9VIBR|nr:pirin family protein [Vibrio panuliri]KAB1454517.1 pirin family protein [Vibrio panuliri]OLQ94948.1 quercetin 2,3-dioxygenase [Vibrio panuliri]